jgi:hypothetical protein
MLEKTKKELSSIEEAINYAEASDMAWTPYYTELLHKRKLLKKEVKKLEKREKKNRRHNEDDD